MHWGRRGPGRRNCDRCKTKLAIATCSTSVVHRHKKFFQICLECSKCYQSIAIMLQLHRSGSAMTLHWNQCYVPWICNALKLMYDQYCDLFGHRMLMIWWPTRAGYSYSTGDCIRTPLGESTQGQCENWSDTKDTDHWAPLMEWKESALLEIKESDDFSWDFCE